MKRETIDDLISWLIDYERSRLKPQYRDEIQSLDDIFGEYPQALKNVKYCICHNDKKGLAEREKDYRFNARMCKLDDYEWETNFYTRLADICKEAL